jgi:hypothetical protein
MTIERTFAGLPSPTIGRAGAGGHPCQGRTAGPRARTARLVRPQGVEGAVRWTSGNPRGNLLLEAVWLPAGLGLAP